MPWGGRYLAVNRDPDGAHSEALEMDNMMMDEPEEDIMETRGAWYVFRHPKMFRMASKYCEFKRPGIQVCTTQVEESSITGLNDLTATNSKTPPRGKRWSDPVWWCVCGNTAILIINVIFIIVATAWTGSQYGGVAFGSNILYEGSCTTAKDLKIVIHLAINIFSLILTATSSLSGNILMSPSRADLDRAHSGSNWLTIGVFSLRNLRNLQWPHRLTWIVLTGTSLIVQFIYNSVIYSSLNANTYAAFVASHDFISNSSIPDSEFEAQSCYSEADLAWNITALRRSILNGEFEVLDPQACIEAYAVEFLSDRRTVIAVTSESMTENSTRLYISCYGWPARIYDAITDNIIENSGLLTQQDAYQTINSYTTGDAFRWICSGNGWNDTYTYQSCSKATAQDMSPWTITGQTWAPSTSIQQVPNTMLDWITVAWETDTDLEFIWTGLNQTERTELQAKLEANPTLEQMQSFVRNRIWSNETFGDALVINASCLDKEWLSADSFIAKPPQRKLAFPVDHCLSQYVDEQCQLLYNMPIGVVIIICNLLKVMCLSFLVNIDRRNLFLTVGDAISSYFQNPDPLTKGWCMLSKKRAKRSKVCPWNASCDPKVRSMPLPVSPPHPENPPTKRRTWSNACKPVVTLATLPILGIYIAMTQILPKYAQAAAQGLPYRDVTISQIWDIKGFGAVQSNALLTNLARTYVGMELLANTPQLLVSLLYFLFNDHLARMLHAADYNQYAVSRRPLRVSFPRGQQRSTFYLSIPYRYSPPLLLAFGLIHWLISEGIFYVQLLPYDLAGNPILSSKLMTCGISTIPLEVAMFLTIACLLVLWGLSAREYKGATMPFALGCSVAISAACHPPTNDTDAAFKSVMWGAVDDDDDDDRPDRMAHCCFTSLEVTQPQKDRMYV
ncbi:hypothetical protein TMatcc_006373 [Talaromyces marneffei ATCC 18224]|uniref:DUF6536 domain-containing protein n=1 Tax=Talaromyces marneffei (strain ATCC 18224 / CBS 334.59 / QM 7333) TaxID=441960 RepID=B6QB62_TALMQ|nr:hypothetical protein PMAA_065140 [Talaromyces marneffei ATCC 18224]KAE8554130.1 hypothetical protein EYB25_002668 [Talaromyces marneffei]